MALLVRSRFYLAAILVSLIFALLRSGPLKGSEVALVIIIVLQLYLPGLLLARVFGRHLASHPIVRFAWILLCGLSLTICLGGIARLFAVKMMGYVLLLHAVMIVLALLPARAPADDEPKWTFRRESIPLYLLVALCCAVILGVGLERNSQRFNGYPDQTVFISQIDWLAHNPDDPSLRDRRVGVAVGDTRTDTEGWTYFQAVWAWESSVPAEPIIWRDMTPLFIWTIPLAVFALAYELTRREEAAAWTVVALTLVGLMTLDGVVYNPTNLAFGRYSLLQVNTLRTFATALATPLALMAGLAYLRRPVRRDLILIFLAGMALAMLHPRQVLIFQISMAVTGALWWLAQPNRQRLIQVGLLAVVIVSLLGLPFIERLHKEKQVNRTEQLSQQLVSEDEGGATLNYLTLPALPLIGRTFIINPSAIFYHPVIVAAAVLGLLWAIGIRKSLTAQYIFGATAIALLLLFTPVLAGAYLKLVSAIVVTGTVFMLPLALVFGLTADVLLRRLGNRERVGQWALATFGALTVLTLIFEPFPIPASARDQIRASNETQALREMIPADGQLVQTLAGLLPNKERSILLTPNRAANFVIEDISHTLITGGRASGNESYQPTARFFTESAPPAPWLDSADLDFINQYHVTHIVVEADDTRLPQLLLEPERFKYLADADGYVIFQVQPDIAAAPTAGWADADALFAQMNGLYGQLTQPRWEKAGFTLTLPGDANAWQSTADAWNAAVTAQPDDGLARFGLGLSYLMMGNDQQALPVWEQLHQNHPDIFLFTDALAHTRAILNPGHDAAVPLLDALNGSSASGRILAAERLLTDTFFYHLSDDELDQITAAADSAPDTWQQLAEFDRSADVRRRAVLMMSRNRLDTAAGWLDHVPLAEQRPQDFIARASIRLAQGNVQQALDILRPTTDPDQIAANIRLHPDLWQSNTANQMYARLMQDESGAPPSPAISLLTMADQRALYVMQPEIQRADDEQTLNVLATFGDPQGTLAFPINSWRVVVASPDASTQYASVEIPANFAGGLLVRAPITVNLPDDIPPLTPARVFIEPRYSNAVPFPQATLDVTLNRPSAAQPPADASVVGRQFGSDITLVSDTASADAQSLTLTLYWQVGQTPAEDYQIFVHVVDANGQTVGQNDSAPVDNRYPTGQWRATTLIEDRHTVHFDNPLASGEYRVLVGLYRLSDLTRLAITPADAQSQDNALTIDTFSMP